MSERIHKVESLLGHQAAEFLNTHSNKTSLITVTRTEVSKDLKNATIFITVFPDSYEAVALDFCNRQRREFKEYIKPKLKMKRIPSVRFEIDYGEKNRQHIDALTSDL